jgi:hypothetical protein
MRGVRSFVDDALVMSGPRARGERSAGLVVEIDLDDAGAYLEVLGAITWPHDEKRRRQFTAVYSAMALYLLEQRPDLLEKPEPVIEGVPQTLPKRVAARSRSQPSTQTVRAVAELERAAPGNGRPISLAAAAACVRRMLFDPAGGLRTLLRAPGTEELFKELDAHHRLGMLAGEALLIVAAMEQHHSDLPPSLNRALAVMDEHPGKQPRRKERTLKATWEQWRAVAPFRAARLALVGPFEAISSPPYPHPVSNERTESLHVSLGLAEGFRRFATTYAPKRARGPLIPAEDALEFRSGVQEITPLLDALPPELYATAHAYKVRAIRR